MSDRTADTGAVSAGDLVAQTDTGARQPPGAMGTVIAATAFIWSLFQLYISSPLPFILTRITGLNLVFNTDEARAIHLAFGFGLAALAYPLFKSSPRDRVPLYDWALLILGVGACLYLVVFADSIATRPGLPTATDLVVSSVGLVVLLISAYRALGLPLVIVASVFLLYVFFGHSAALPDAIQWKGASYGKAMWHFWMQTEGVFGVALGVSASMIFLFVLFGALLDKAGAGNYFIQVAYSLLGHLRGGPAKAAVLSSAMTGMISGSSIANTVTTGTFTIPLMKRTGFPAEKAGAVEVASSTNGQLTPPVMGAAAFLMVEYVGISYLEVVRHAFLPAVISYIALLYIVHLEALKLGLKGMERSGPARTALERLFGVATGFVGVIVLAAALYYGLGWTKDVFGDATFYAVGVIFVLAYLALLKLAASYPDLKVDDPEADITEIPDPKRTAVTGLYFLLPIVVLVWCLMIERLSPALSAYWATVCMVFIVLTQHPIKAFFRGESDYAARLRRGVAEFIAGMISGARNMIGIAVATGAAGVIVGTISLTGAHQVMGEFVEFLSGGSLMLMLFFVAVLSLILGMGLPTTANYIVVSSLMAPVIVSLGAANGLIVPLIAVHMFVFYFGILADDTPPVGLAAFAAAAISRGDPIMTGVQGFMYDIRTALLPFLFIFNTDLLLINVTFVQGIFVFIVALIAMLLFAAATQGYFLARSRLWETAALLLIAFTLFRPGYWLDQVADPYVEVQATQIFEAAEAKPSGDTLRVLIEGEELGTGQIVSKAVRLPLGEAGPSGEERLLANAGLEFRVEGDRVFVDNLEFGGFAEQNGIDFDWEVLKVEVAADRMPKEVFYLPALALLVVVVLFQRRRQTVPAF
ncbi:MAG: TRAP transporter permease [Alphaproteobacteria bacterium]|nr:TRAP transporter permease [Alphaproteobacteria bacterium]MDX5368570.1 TRAP transporter permease [Alphaproteobacteria bacterium]MDX5463321.1 TRAP transporter permease [Alphaproteobacteria bacterium]